MPARCRPKAARDIALLPPARFVLARGWALDLRQMSMRKAVVFGICRIWAQRRGTDKGERQVRLLVLAAIVASLGLCAALAQGQQPSASQPRTEAQGNSYVPDLGDIMETAQLRHFKLSYAGTVKNWILADYELAQITKSLLNTAKLYPDFANIAQAKLVREISEPALAQVGDAIKAKDSDAFARTFSKLTQACNSCHQAAGFGFIVIRVPTASPFSNQLFSPSRE